MEKSHKAKSEHEIKMLLLKRKQGEEEGEEIEKMEGNENTDTPYVVSGECIPRQLQCCTKSVGLRACKDISDIVR